MEILSRRGSIIGRCRSRDPFAIKRCRPYLSHANLDVRWASFLRHLCVCPSFRNGSNILFLQREVIADGFSLLTSVFMSNQWPNPKPGIQVYAWRNVATSVMIEWQSYEPLHGLSVCYLFAMFVPSVKWMEVIIALGASEGLEIPLARPSEAALRLMRRRIKWQRQKFRDRLPTGCYFLSSALQKCIRMLFPHILAFCFVYVFWP